MTLGEPPRVPLRSTRGDQPAVLFDNKKVTDIKMSHIKRVDLGYASDAFAVNPAFIGVGLNRLVQGTGNYQRVGSEVHLGTLRLRGQVALPAASYLLASPACTCRLLVVYDRGGNGVAPVWADVIASTTLSGVVSSSVLDGPNLAGVQRFVIMHDRYIRMPARAVGGGIVGGFAPDSADIEIDEDIYLDGIPSRYGTNTGSITDVNSGGLFLLLQSDQNVYDFAWAAQLSYID